MKDSTTGSQPLTKPDINEYGPGLPIAKPGPGGGIEDLKPATSEYGPTRI